MAEDVRNAYEQHRLKMTLFKLIKNDEIKKFRMDSYVIFYKKYKRMWAVREFCILAKAVKLYSLQAKRHLEQVQFRYRETMAKFVG